VRGWGGRGGTIFIQLNSQGGVFLDFLSKQAERGCIFHQFQDSKLQGTNTNIYSHDRSASYSAAGKYVDRFWLFINCSQTHECGN
jgi:hypothetical protein